LGYRGFGGERDIVELHRTRSGEENLEMKRKVVEVKDYDDHAVHITEHTAFLLSEKLTGEQEKRIIAHLEIHKKLLEVNNGQPDTTN
jgi:hypothetical protein